MALEKFHFTVDGTDYELPKQINSGSLRKIRNLDPLDQSLTLFEQNASPEALAAWDTIEPHTAGLKIINDWFQGLNAKNS